jgi:hypothetical protein
MMSLYAQASAAQNHISGLLFIAAEHAHEHSHGAPDTPEGLALRESFERLAVRQQAMEEWACPALLCLMAAALAGAIAWPASRRFIIRAWAVARVTAQEAVRAWVPWIGLALHTGVTAAAMAGAFPMGGSAEARARTTLTVSLMSASFFAFVTAIFISATAVSGEISSRKIQMTASKPAGRACYLFGKFAGAALVPLGLLAAMGVVTWAAAAVEVYRCAGPDPLAPREEMAPAEMEVRPGPRVNEVPLVWSEDRLVHAKGLELPAGDSENPDEAASYRIRVPESALSEDEIIIRVRAIRSKSGMGESAKMRLYLAAARPDGGEVRIDMAGAALTPMDARVPRACAQGGMLEFRIGNRSPEGAALLLPEPEIRGSGQAGSVRLAVKREPFFMALGRGLLQIWMMAAFTAAATIAASSFVSFTVASVAGFAVTVTWFLSAFVLTLVARHGTPLHEAWAWLLFVLPDFDRYGPMEALAAGQYTGWNLFTAEVCWLTGVRGAVVVGIACWLFRRRELG